MRIVVFLAIVVMAATLAGYFSLRSFNHFTTIERDFAGVCTPFSGIAGPEDIQVDRKRGIAFISSLDRRDHGARGAIHIFRLADPLDGAGFRDRTGGDPEAFQPLGIDYFERGDSRRLFVVNAETSSVDVFEANNDGSLSFLERFTERRLNSPNNVVAVGPREFYVTNDQKPGRGTRMGALHFLMRTGSGQVLHVNGETTRLVADGLRFANGIDISADGKRVYVAETAGNAIRIYLRDPDTGLLTRHNSIKLDAAPDNITVDENDHVWIAAMPKPLATRRHRTDPNYQSPSEIYRLDANSDLDVIYRDPGGEISAATSAAYYKGSVLIGGLFDAKFLICNLPTPADPA